MATQLQKQVEKQKKEAEKKFSSWFINKFKKNKTQYIRDQDEKSAEQERLRRQKAQSSSSSGSISTTASSSSSSHSSGKPRHHAPDSASMQRQQSFLRAQLLEMKRHSHEVLQHAKSRELDSSDEEYDEVHSVLGEDDENNSRPSSLRKRRSGSHGSRTRQSLTSSDGHQSDNQTDDEDEEKKGNDTDDEDAQSHRGSVRSSFASNGGGSQRNSFTGASSQRNSISEELDRRSSRATLLYEEAIHALEEVLHPDKPRTRSRRSDSAGKRLFAQPESEWI